MLCIYSGDNQTEAFQGHHLKHMEFHELLNISFADLFCLLN